MSLIKHSCFEMGITRELVRSVFSKTRASKTHENQEKNNRVDKKRRPSVKAYLCGEEFSSVQAEEDSASLKSSETTITQPTVVDSIEKGEELQSQEKIKDGEEEAHSLELIISSKEVVAAIIIQSAFRSFMVRRQCKTLWSRVGKEELPVRKESPGRESMATSIEVQMGNSIDAISIQEESIKDQNSVPPKSSKSQLYKPKEEWDDSTIDSTVSKLRLQNRLEAMTRREKALAYAFSQQLRISSKKKQAKAFGTETDTELNWLERWMATRKPEGCSVESPAAQVENHTTEPNLFTRKRFLDLSVEGKESCGSNDVPVQIECSATQALEGKDRSESTKTKLKATRNVSRRKTVPTHQHFPKEHAKANKKGNSREAGKDKNQKAQQAANTEEETTEQPSSVLQMDDQASESSKV